MCTTFFREVLETDLLTVEKWWNSADLGLFRQGNQDKIVYQLKHKIEMLGKMKMLPLDTFNIRLITLTLTPRKITL